MKRIFIVFLLSVLFINLVGCTEQPKGNQSNSNPTIASVPKTSKTKSATNDYIYLVEESSENLISVQIPVVKTANAKKVNACIKNQVYHELQWWLLPERCDLKESLTPIDSIGEKMNSLEYTTNYLYITSRISFESEDMISIVFTGNQNSKSAAHPNNVFFTINVAVHTAERIGIADIYSIEDDQYDAFLRYVHSERIAHDELLLLNVFDKNMFFEGLALEPEKEVYSYFTSAGVGISYPVPYALGNHIEAEIPYEEWKATIK